jgi:hypothetical protein
MIEMVINILREFPVSHTPELAPMALWCPYKAAMLGFLLDRISGLRRQPTLVGTSFELMINGLRHFSTVWPCTGAIDFRLFPEVWLMPRSSIYKGHPARSITSIASTIISHWMNQCLQGNGTTYLLLGALLLLVHLLRKYRGITFEIKPGPGEEMVETAARCCPDAYLQDVPGQAIIRHKRTVWTLFNKPWSIVLNKDCSIMLCLRSRLQMQSHLKQGLHRRARPI